MLTFLELYQTLLGFIFYKLYSDENLVYPPKLDADKDNEGAGIGAFMLQESSRTLTISDQPSDATSAQQHRQASAKDVKKQIKNMAKARVTEGEDEEENGTDGQSAMQTDAANGEDSRPLFENYYFYLSREVTRPTLEFVIRSFGGQVGWDATLGSASPYTEDDPRITHHIVDRPLPEDPEALSSLLSARAALGKRAWVQPQWVVDCVNAESLLPTGRYAPGETLPPHLSPFVDHEKEQRQGRYVPSEALAAAGVEAEGEEEESEPSSSEEEEEDEGDQEAEEDEWGGIGEDDVADVSMEQAPASKKKSDLLPPALAAAAQDPTNESLRHEAELEAERLGISTADFEAQLAKASKANLKKTSSAGSAQAQKNLDSIMIASNKNRKAYAHLQKRKERIAEDKARFESKKKAAAKADKQQQRK